MQTDWMTLIITIVSIVFGSGIVTVLTLKQIMKSSKLNVVKEELEVAKIRLTDELTESKMLRDEVKLLIEQCHECRYKLFYFEKRKELNEKIDSKI